MNARYVITIGSLEVTRKNYLNTSLSQCRIALAAICDEGKLLERERGLIASGWCVTPGEWIGHGKKVLLYRQNHLLK